MTYILRHSRLKAILPVFGMTIFVFGFGIFIIALLMERERQLLLDQEYTFGLWFVLGLLFLVPTFICMCMGWVIVFKRLLFAPVILKIDDTGIYYYHSVFHKKNKVIVIPWEKVHDFSFTHTSVPRTADFGEVSVPVETQIGHLKIFVEAGYLKGYSMWRDNLFLSHKDTGSSLSILCDDFKNFDREALYAFAYDNIVARLPQKSPSAQGHGPTADKKVE